MLDADELREIRSSLEDDQSKANIGFGDVAALGARVTALEAALAVLLEHLIDSAEKAPSGRND